jgi:Leucine-rich repeat (LRR) protein
MSMTFNSTGNTQNWFIQGSGIFTMTINWGDGQLQGYTGSDNYTPTHTYSGNGNYISNITFSDPTLITYLDISTGYGDNRLKDITGLEFLTNLNSLMLGGNLITNFNSKLSGLSSSVQTLDLSYNQLSAFTPTVLPQGLTNLYLNNNLLTGFTPTISFPLNMTNLYLNNNLLTIYNPSSPIPSIQTLNLSYNSIVNFSPNQPLPSSLNTLNLSYNPLTTFNPWLSGNPFPNSVEYLYLDDNSLSSNSIGTILINLSATTYWTNPNTITLFNQTGGGCLVNPSSGYTAYQSLTTSGWTIDVDIC